MKGSLLADARALSRRVWERRGMPWCVDTPTGPCAQICHIYIVIEHNADFIHDLCDVSKEFSKAVSILSCHPLINTVHQFP